MKLFVTAFVPLAVYSHAEKRGIARRNITWIVDIYAQGGGGVSRLIITTVYFVFGTVSLNLMSF